MDASRCFVGRRALLRELLVEPVAQCYAIWGQQGAGKSWLLDKLRDEQVARGLLPAVPKLDVAGPSAAGQPDDLNPDFRVFRHALRVIAEPMGVDVDRFFPSVVQSGSSTVHAFSPKSTSVHTSSEPELATSEIESAVRHAVDGLKAQVESRPAPPDDRRLLVLVDDLDRVKGRRLADWLVGLLVDLSGTTVVLTVRSEADLPAADGRIVCRRLADLTNEEVHDYVRERSALPTSNLSSLKDEPEEFERVVDTVFQYTNGYPMAMALTVDLIDQSPEQEHSMSLIRRLSASQENKAEKLHSLVEGLLIGVDAELKEAMECVWVVRHFDAPLLRHMLDKPEDVDVGGLLERLQRYSFVKSPGEAPSSDDDSYTLHEFVRDWAERRLRLQDRARYCGWHKRAAEYYAGALGRYEDEHGEDSAYEAWFRFEDPRWQRLEWEWLYHTSHLEGADRVVGRLSAARLYLDAFWWWGCYVPFPFCDRILHDAELVLADDDDRAWFGSLKRLADCYPMGWRKGDAPPEKWRGVRQSLLFIEQRGGLAGDHPDAEVRRHLRGIVDIFLAHASRYLDPMDTRADERLEDALEQFGADKDEWNAAWVRYEWADLQLDRRRSTASEPEAGFPGDAGHLAAIAERLTAAAQTAASLDDRELVANAHRVYADALWLEGDAAGALDSYGRAALHAYHFQIKDQPDAYTEAFLTEMVERTAGPFDELLASGRGDLAREGARRMQRLFAPYWSLSGGRRALAADEPTNGLALAEAALPPGPSLADLHLADCDYALCAREVADAMRRELGQPLGEPLAG